MCNSSMTLLAIAVDRYFVVCRNESRKRRAVRLTPKVSERARARASGPPGPTAPRAARARARRSVRVRRARGVRVISGKLRHAAAMRRERAREQRCGGAIISSAHTTRHAPV